MKTLLVGDPHIQIQKLEDGKLFVERLTSLAKDHETVIILGDLFHTFAVIRSEVMSTWYKYFSVHGEKTIALVGNHDYAGQRGGHHALEVFKDTGSTIVDGLVHIDDNIICLPFLRDNNEFESLCKKLPKGAILFCHQSFTGASFGNGFYDPHGANPNCVSHLKSVVSGHIHKRQTFNNIWYPGVPYQHSFAEADYETRVFTIDLKPSGYEIVRGHDLDMPRYSVLSGDISELPDMLPTPRPTDSYKIVSKGTPAEISAFWNNKTVKTFKSRCRRVVDGIVPERGELPSEIFREHKTKREKFETFIKSRKWRTSGDVVSAAAGTFIT